MKIPEIKIPKEKIITKFCLFVHTHDLALHGYFTGFYRVKGQEYIANNSDFRNERIKFFTAKNVYKKAENLFFDFGFESSEDCIYVCSQTGKKIKRYNGVDSVFPNFDLNSHELEYGVQRDDSEIIIETKAKIKTGRKILVRLNIELVSE